MVLVNIRCKAKGCRRLLGTVEQRPGSLDGELVLAPCSRHNGTGPTSLKKFAEWAQRNYRAGDPLPTRILEIRIKWKELLPIIEQAERTGRTQTTTV